MGSALAFDEQLLMEEIRRLPAERVAEVFDFVGFLRDKKKNAVYDKMWDDSVATDLLRGYSQKDAAYDKL